MNAYLADFDWLLAIGVFWLYVVMDALYAYYTLSVTKLQPLKASLAGAAMYTLGAMGVLSYTHNPLYLVPLSLGSFAGTYVIMKREQLRSGSAR